MLCISPYSLRIGKIQTRKTPNAGTFHTVWLSLTFSCKREHLMEIQWLSVKLKFGRMSECNEVKHMKEIYRLTHGKEIFWYSYEFAPQVRSYSTVLRSKECKLTGPLTFDPTLDLARPQLVTHSAMLSLHFTCIWFLKVGISAYPILPI